MEQLRAAADSREMCVRNRPLHKAHPDLLEPDSLRTSPRPLAGYMGSVQDTMHPQCGRALPGRRSW
jgi:hypothetical protein